MYCRIINKEFIIIIIMYPLIIIILVILTIPLIYIAWFKIKYSFWSKQPVFNYYNLYYWIHPYTVIDEELPEMNKYYNIRNIVFKDVASITPTEINEVIELLQNHYYKNDTIHYFPKKSNVIPYLSNNNNNSYISIYYKNKKAVGILTGRTLEVSINNTSFLTYYADFLCVHEEYRKQEISPKMIYTHYYNQRHREPSILTSLFKREHTLNHYVPLVEYQTYTFNVKNWITYSLHNCVKILSITKENINILHEFIRKEKQRFKCFISSHISNILELIKTKNIYVYCVIINDKVYAAYFLRDLCTNYLKNKSLECFASIKNCSDELFLYCFSNVVFYYKEYNPILLIEDVSDNDIIIKNILLKYSYMSKVSCGFYFYNYASLSVKKKEFCCIY